MTSSVAPISFFIKFNANYDYKNRYHRLYLSKRFYYCLIAFTLFWANVSIMSTKKWFLAEIPRKCQLKVRGKWLNFVLRNCRARLFKQTIFSNFLTENYLIIYFTYMLKIHSPISWRYILGPQVERFQFLNPRILKR